MRIKNLKHQYLGDNKHYLFISDGSEKTLSYRQNNVCMHCESYLQPDGDQSHYKFYQYWVTLHGQERIWMPFCSERCYKEYPRKSELFGTIDEFVAKLGKEKFEHQQKEKEQEKREYWKKRQQALETESLIIKAQLQRDREKNNFIRTILWIIGLTWLIKDNGSRPLLRLMLIIIIWSWIFFILIALIAMLFSSNSGIDNSRVNGW
jgi:hypothetical protein